MTKQEIAIKYGVPMPETCKALDWKLPTKFVWYGHLLCFVVDNYKIVNVETGNMINRNENWTLQELKEKCIPAPQMHEIAPVLPPNLEFNGVWYDLFIANQVIGYHYYNGVETIYLAVECLTTKHFTDHLANLYLKLKEKNLLNF